jgi:demethylmenaquinone methyltransferase/2-methoxy-6-polyprenyl-1,4-benzoquinol methylase
MNPKDKTTDFGFQKVPWGEKQKRVGAVFDSVAGRYDLMNDLMSFGIHRLWKKFAIELAAVRTGERVLDLAGGTGDLSTAMAARVGAKGQVICSDINFSMLGVGRQRLTDRGVAGNVAYVQANAEALPFADNRLDCITIGFGLRNVTDKQAALGSMYRVLRPGGRLLILEFSKPQLPGLSKLYDEYSFRFLPLMGRLVAQDSDSYRYLAESIRMHPDQETLKRMMEQAGYARCQFYNLTGGIVAVHRGYKL